MLVVTTEVWPHGQLHSRPRVGRVAIWNDGTGDHHYGNYGYVIVDEGSPAGGYGGWTDDFEFLEFVCRVGELTVSETDYLAAGTIKQFPRHKGQYALLEVVLNKSGFCWREDGPERHPVL